LRDDVDARTPLRDVTDAETLVGVVTEGVDDIGTYDGMVVVDFAHGVAKAVTIVDVSKLFGTMCETDIRLLKPAAFRSEEGSITEDLMSLFATIEDGVWVVTCAESLDRDESPKSSAIHETFKTIDIVCVCVLCVRGYKHFRSRERAVASVWEKSTEKRIVR
jgi:hypothetical protein